MPAIVFRLSDMSREQLTYRERIVLQRVIQGYSNKEIAIQIHVSVNTVKFHLKNIYSKIGAHRRTQAAAIATGLGLVALS